MNGGDASPMARGSCSPFVPVPAMRTKLPNEDWLGRAWGAAAADDGRDGWLVARRRIPCPYDDVRVTVGAWGRTAGTRREWRVDNVRRSFPCPPCEPNCPMMIGRARTVMRERRTKLPDEDWLGRARGAAAADDGRDGWLVARRRTVRLSSRRSPMPLR